jgi:transposase
VSITKLADGWWASIKQEIPPRQIPDAIPGSVVGIDVGLDCLAAISDGTPAPARYINNPREKTYAERIAGRQSMGKPVGRLQQRAARDIRHRIYNCIVKPLATIETIKVERLNGRIGQMGSRMTSSMRMTTRILKERYPTRVREVDCAFTSQDCSQCGHRSKESWSYEHGKTGQCPKCGHRENRDGNASRNIALKDPIPLDL